MAINVNFYTFSKKYNSTAQPTGDGTVLSCNIKAPSSVINPRLELATNPTAYNYCYISAFSRYYFVSDITFSNGLWICMLTEDVLATYKTQIGGSSLYILRSSAQSNGYIQDGYFPPTTKVTRTDADMNSTLYNYDDGCYIVNILSGSNNGIVSYQLSHSGFKDLYDKIFTLVNGYDWTDVAVQWYQSIFKITDYLVSAYWFPETFGTPTSGSIALGPYTISGISRYHVDGPKYDTYSVTLPKHPKAATYGKYLNAAPFSHYTVSFGPLSETAIDAALLVDTTTFTLSKWVDPVTGQAIITVPGASYTIGWGVPIALANSNSGSAAGVLTSIGSVVGAVAAGGLTGGLAPALGVVGGIAGAIESAAGSNSIASSAGSIAAHNRFRGVSGYFADVVDRDITNLGLPLCTVTTPSALGGYMVVQNGSINAAGTAAELASIKGYLEGGFYYE